MPPPTEEKVLIALAAELTKRGHPATYEYPGFVMYDTGIRDGARTEHLDFGFANGTFGGDDGLWVKDCWFWHSALTYISPFEEIVKSAIDGIEDWKRRFVNGQIN